jgi:hypothetical protein
MAQEIELKFIVDHAALTRCASTCNALNASTRRGSVAEYLLRKRPITGCAVTIWGCASAAIRVVMK